MDSLAQPPQNASLILREDAPAERAEIECLIRQCFATQHLTSITRFMPRMLSLHAGNGHIANFGRVFVCAVLTHKEYDKGDLK